MNNNNNVPPPVDIKGVPFNVGDRVVRAVTYGSGSASLKFCIVTKIKDGKVYLDDSHVPMRYHKHSLMILDRNI